MSKAYVAEINTIGSNVTENNSVHQTCPAWVLSFVRWEERDSLRTEPTKTTNPFTVRGVPLVVENDCIQLEVVSNKGTFTASMSATLVMTDVNYETSIAPGDFVFVNILNWESDAKVVAQKALNGQAINGILDGFKGVFKIQAVRKSVTVIDPQVGTKAVLIKITGFAFSEFNNSIYFNDQLFSQEEKESNLLFLRNLGDDWTQIVKALAGYEDSNLQYLIKFLIDSFIGAGVPSQDGLVVPNKVFNTHFFIPILVGSLLGIPQAKAAKDCYSYIFGLQNYRPGASQSIAQGMNPSGLQQQENNFWYTDETCKGYFVPASGMWNGEKAWSIMNQYVNSPLNELYTCFKVSPNGRVMPTVIFRQAPFTKEDFSNLLAEEKFPATILKFPVTRFMHLPRWKINPALVISLEVGRDDAARINFVQYTGNSFIGAGFSAMEAIAKGNFLYDIDDVQRNSLRPAMYSTPYDIAPDSDGSLSPGWAKIIGDFLIGGHLLMSGTIMCAGIVDPIAVGDNLEFDGTVYHIEQVVHQSVINPVDGRKTFRTAISLSHGMSVDSEVGATRYSEMTYPNAYKLRNIDYENNQLLPGVSESQDIIGRENNTDQIPTINAPFVQPNIGVSVNTASQGETDKT